MDLRRHFIEHPASVDETYGEHARAALGFAASLAAASVAAAVHAVVPALCGRSASRRVCALYDKMTTGKRAANAPQRLAA